ncbi:hypothetical protein J4223_00050 [Candidatus Woesearchaeota archaeon]|nr:hypothetical protein [Candidatus Woesearchaeota archaeon]
MYQKTGSSYVKPSSGSYGVSSNGGYEIKTSRRKKDGCCEGGCGTACVRYKNYQ